MAGWTTTQPSGVSWGTEYTGNTGEASYYYFRGLFSYARGKNNTLYVKCVLQVDVKNTAYLYYPYSVRGDVKIGSGSYISTPVVSVESGHGVSSDGWKTVGPNYYLTTTASNTDKVYCRTGWSSGTPVSSDKVLSAKPYTTKYYIYYQANGGSGSTADSEFTYGGSTTVRANSFTAPTGKHFVGWKDGNGNPYSVGASYSTAANLTLYAQWDWNTYTVSYNGNSPDGTPVTGLPASQTKTHGTSLPLSSGEPECEGFVFSHWNTAADDSGTSFNPGAAFTIEANTVLYAIWFGTWPVTYDGNGATGGATEGQTKIEDVDITIRSNGFVRDKYTFVQWNTASDGSGTAYDPGDTYEDNAALTLYAIWLKNNIPVYYNDGETVRQAEKAYIMKNGEVLPVTLYIKKNDVVYEVS